MNDHSLFDKGGMFCHESVLAVRIAAFRGCTVSGGTGGAINVKDAWMCSRVVQKGAIGDFNHIFLGPWPFSVRRTKY